MALTDSPIPVLFLFDEILHGTNSHDRVIGAEAIIRRILQRKAVGLVTTHDLALADIANTLSPQVMNVHFEDHVNNGKIEFDYRMRPGVVKKSNALALMRAVGLEV
jgi:DNA mismatch repair ATPase MutS